MHNTLCGNHSLSKIVETAKDTICGQVCPAALLQTTSDEREADRARWRSVEHMDCLAPTERIAGKGQWGLRVDPLTAS